MKRVGTYLILIFGLILVLGGAVVYFVTRTETGFRLYLDAMYKRDFADVKLIPPEELDRELAGPNPPLLLDTRSADEYHVSHLNHAMRVDPASFGATEAAGFDRDRPIIVYCSIGYRSGRVAQKLQSYGFRNVRNLYGGIFLWYNQGRPVFAESGQVEHLHPYNSTWGMFVTRAGKTTAPD